MSPACMRARMRGSVSAGSENSTLIGCSWLMPTIPFAVEGLTMEPSVSVPTATTHKFAETATADPELEPRFQSFKHLFLELHRLEEQDSLPIPFRPPEKGQGRVSFTQ